MGFVDMGGSETTTPYSLVPHFNERFGGQVLKLTPFQADYGTVTNSAKVIKAIEIQAIARWGEANWKAELARAAVHVMRENGDLDTTYEGRRRQLYRVFETGGCNLETAIALVEAVGCKFQIACPKQVVSPNTKLRIYSHFCVVTQ